ncbi:hypothetical protein ABKN59_011568 [Abortiporus biennis]
MGSYKCSFCGEKISRQQYGDQNNRKSHAALKKHEVFKCGYCDKVFLDPEGWHAHTSSLNDSKHFGKLQQIPLYFPCESCSTKTFDSLMLLNEHKKKEHSALQPPPTVASISSTTAALISRINSTTSAPAQPSLPSTKNRPRVGRSVSRSEPVRV